MSRFKSIDVEENVACNLIPMIDIMFLLLLFFMLSADMSQRQIEDVKLPIAEQVKEDPKTKEGIDSLTINVVVEEGKSIVKIAGHAYVDWAELKADLTELARASEEPGNPAGQFYSSREIMIRADTTAQYKEVQHLIQTCSAVGFYKIEVGASKPMPGAEVAKK